MQGLRRQRERITRVRYAVIADVHGNFHALEAVLTDINEQGADVILCLGDVVGYAAMPEQCMRTVREKCARVVAGNHDHGVVEKIDSTYFNADARDALYWTAEQLSEDDLAWLEALPLTAEFEDVLLVHSTLYFPEYFSYIRTLYDAALAFSKMEQRIGFIGHSHVPIAFVNSDPIDYFLLAEFQVPEHGRLIVNVGSVGQPRDLDPRACYVLLDTERNTVYFRRVEYDIAAAAEAIMSCDLPATNARRLLLGR